MKHKLLIKLELCNTKLKNSLDLQLLINLYEEIHIFVKLFRKISK